MCSWRVVAKVHLFPLIFTASGGCRVATPTALGRKPLPFGTLDLIHPVPAFAWVGKEGGGVRASANPIFAFASL